MFIQDPEGAIPQTEPVVGKVENLFDEKNIAYQVLASFFLHTTVSFEHLERLGLDKNQSLRILILLKKAEIFTVHGIPPDVIPGNPEDFSLSQKGWDLYYGIKSLEKVSKEMEKQVSE